MNLIELYFERTIGYTSLMRLEDIVGVLCALILGHLLTMLFTAFVFLKMKQDRKLTGFSVIRAKEIDGTVKYRVNPQCIMESIDIIYGVFWVWLWNKQDATFSDSKRVKIIQIILIVLFIILTSIGTLLSLKVTMPTT